jgi:two-component system sensor histidine kinase AlgZ
MSPRHAFWLPDFCRLPRLAAVCGIAELVVVVDSLAPLGRGGWLAQEFLAGSFFALWAALTSALLLCQSRPWVARLPTGAGIALAIAQPVLVTALGAWLLMQLDQGLGLGHTTGADGLRFVAGSAAIAGLIGAIALRYFYVNDQWQAQVQAHAKAEVDALQARIRPHFLFNSMNTIAALVRRDPATAERAVEDLSELFRAALGAGQGEATLAEEIHLGERYLAIESLRLGDRLQVEWRIGPDVPRDLRLPRLSLQPLLENAVLHGIARLTDGGRILIEMERKAGRLRIRITNPAPRPNGDGAGNRHAQESIALRLAHRFGPQASLTHAWDDGYYVSELLLPLP